MHHSKKLTIKLWTNKLVAPKTIKCVFSSFSFKPIIFQDNLRGFPITLALFLINLAKHLFYWARLSRKVFVLTHGLLSGDLCLLDISKQCDIHYDMWLFRKIDRRYVSVCSPSLGQACILLDIFNYWEKMLPKEMSRKG